ncbi:unnamed protein product [Effrenium voratum]|uniref:Uncharacterized protein n=3 Tax=Effrenium voratum TaxID=2562239 RepID=A0AA36J4R2_9DINO|nr:unnamed protein product [Effrenium voratum]
MVSARKDDKSDAGEAMLDRILEDLRLRVFQDSKGAPTDGDPRSQTIFERMAEKLLEGPSRAEIAEAKAGQRLPSTWTRQWKAYVAKCLASIDRRSELRDGNNQPRVTRVYNKIHALQHVELADWQGRPRARIVFNGADVVEVLLTDLRGKQERHTQQSFALSAKACPKESFQRARLACVPLLDAARAEGVVQSLEELCREVFPRLDMLFKRELDEGRQFVPCAEDLEEMSFEVLLDELEKLISQG